MVPAVEPRTRSKRGAEDCALPTRVGTGLSPQRSKDCSRGFRGEQTALAILKWRGHRRASRHGVPMGTKYSGRAWKVFSLSATWRSAVRLMLRPHDSARHHERPYDGEYCMATGWCNRSLEAVAFFRRLEG